MPELPEVATIINTLKQSSMMNKEVTDVIYYRPKVLRNCSPNEFSKFIIHEKFTNITRKGKFLVFHLTHHKFLVIHLRMEGKLFYELITKNIPQQHLMVQINFKNHYFLGYYDSRMFGTFHIYYSQKELDASTELSRVGFDPFEKEMTGQYLFDKIRHLRVDIKSAIMDQSIISGIGNIYASEILFECHLHPLTKCNTLSQDDCNNIIKYAQKIMQQSINAHGTTVFSYKFDKNHTGEFQKYLMVYDRENQPCFACKTPIKKIKVKQRGTYFCPKCQKLK